jgi:uncharacterized protein (TIRG00374 family)
VDTSGAKGGKGRGIWIAVALAMVIVILTAYWLRGFDWKQFFTTFARVDWRWLSVSLVLLLFTYIGRALRWEVMLRPIRPKPSLWNITTSTVIGFTSIVLLGRAGEIVRPYLVSVKEHVTFSSQMAAWALERIFDMLAVLLIFGIALVLYPPDPHLKPSLQWILRAGGYFIASIGTACVVLLVAFRNFAVPAQRRILSAVSFLPEKIHGRVEKVLTAFVEGMKCTHNTRYLALLLGYTVLQWVVIVAGNWCLFRAVPATAPLGLDKVMIFLGFVAFGSMVQLPGIGGGVQVASLVVLTELLHVPKEAATVLAVLSWICGWIAIVPFGVAFALQDGLNWKRISDIRKEAQPGPAIP